jgi:nicotinate-nucleotide pyrophosphorylase (carboxylating)
MSRKMKNMPDLDKKRIDAIVRFALKEDVWTGDLTSQAVLDRFLKAEGVIISREKGVICGIDIAERVFSAVDCSTRFRPAVKDSDTVHPDMEVAFVEGDAQSILKAERTALNFMGIMSGVATNTRKLVEAVEGTGVEISDTRKTVPLHRYLQKYAVMVGGGRNHRKGLWDMVIIKDNHIRAFSMQTGLSEPEDLFPAIIGRARSQIQKNIKVEVEVETIAECEAALKAGPDVIMLDNMAPETIAKAVEVRKNLGLAGVILFEVSGGITLNNIHEYALSGVDMISSGALTSSVRSLDLSLEIIFRK